MKTCSLHDFMQEIGPWLDQDYIRHNWEIANILRKPDSEDLYWHAFATTSNQPLSNA